MIHLLIFLICFCACTVGAICGIGGGIIIKPALDTFGIMSASTINFLSGCTVLAMTTYSFGKNKLAGTSKIDQATGIPLALGAAIGGVFGKSLFQMIRSMSSDPTAISAIQAACLVIITLGTLIYTIYKSRITTHHVTNKLACVVIGLLLGIMSSFLGIGGGPINLVVLFFFFSMDTKKAAENSLYIILFSQTASLISTLATRTVPEFDISILCLMIAGGIIGGIMGRKINKKLDEAAVDKLFIALMILMIVMNTYNFFKYM
ncbi:MAG: sulfite exporter TauE/SafE family protein [Firmicutes bacterium]|nr:sulfite exporter TauE/SafE family protein [Bacillota bacterium]